MTPDGLYHCLMCRAHTSVLHEDRKAKQKERAEQWEKHGGMIFQLIYTMEELDAFFMEIV